MVCSKLIFAFQSKAFSVSVGSKTTSGTSSSPAGTTGTSGALILRYELTTENTSRIVFQTPVEKLKTPFGASS